jgi:hypothetical protein
MIFGWYTIVALFVAIFTSAEITPSALFNTRLTVEEHDAHVIPSIGITIVLLSTCSVAE